MSYLFRKRTCVWSTWCKNKSGYLMAAVHLWTTWKTEFLINHFLLCFKSTYWWGFLWSRHRGCLRKPRLWVDWKKENKNLHHGKRAVTKKQPNLMPGSFTLLKFKVNYSLEATPICCRSTVCTSFIGWADTMAGSRACPSNSNMESCQKKQNKTNLAVAHRHSKETKWGDKYLSINILLHAQHVLQVPHFYWISSEF